MGVLHLWDILSPVGEKCVRISKLSGKTLAVDLSMWIVEFRKCEGTAKLSNLYLRNLLYRTLEFMKDGVNLIFVLDGLAPEIKHEKLKKQRGELTFKMTSDALPSNRPYLERYSAECVALIECLGIPWISSPGEADQMCAYLNQKEVVDGCITKDSDFFCYGGQTMYRNLRKESKLYIVDLFEMDRINTDLGLNRADLVGMALLLGCDYNNGGVKNVGKDKAVTLMKSWKEKGMNSLDRILSWHDNKQLDVTEQKMKHGLHKESHCKKCDHTGNIKSHEKTGCSLCKTRTECRESCDIVCDCDWHREGQLISEHKLEVTVRQKSREAPDFVERSKKIVEEYMKPDLGVDITKADFIQKPINLKALLDYLGNKLHMPQTKVLEVITPVLVISQLFQDTDTLMYTPVRIERNCKQCGVEGYLVSWDKTDRNMWPMVKSIEVKVSKKIFAKKFPHFVKQFEDRVSIKISAGKRKQNSKKSLDTSTPKKKKSLNTESSSSSTSLASKNQRPITMFMNNIKRQLDLDSNTS